MAPYLNKQQLYEAVKVLVEAESFDHIHLPQHKLFTLFSIAFQYMLFTSTKSPGTYLIRVEDSSLAEKLARKAKDPSTKKFIQSLLTNRKFKYKASTFILDFFNVNSWGLIGQVQRDKLKTALIVKNTSSKPMDDTLVDAEITEEIEPSKEPSFNNSLFPKDYYRTSLTENFDKTITIAYGAQFENTEPIVFSFIKEDGQKALSGVKISSSINIDHFESE